MARIPFLETLSKRARQAYPIIQRGVREGLSANRLQDTLREQGLGIRRQTLLDIVREERGVQERASNVRNIRRDRRPNPDRLPTALTKIRREFSFQVRVRGADRLTGEDRERFVTVTTDSLLTRAEAEDTAASFLEDEPERYALDDVSFTLIGARRAGAAGTLQPSR